MTIINLRDFYYWYTQDEYIEVTDDVAEALRASVRYEAAYQRRLSRHKAQYSLDCEDGISPWDDVRIKNWAGAIGKYTAEVVGRIFEGVSIKEQGYNPALAVLRLSNKYSEARLEAACEFAVTNGIKKPRYHHLSSILAANQDEIYMEQKKASDRAKTPMGYLRGSDYYGGGRNDQ